MTGHVLNFPVYLGDEALASPGMVSGYHRSSERDSMSSIEADPTRKSCPPPVTVVLAVRNEQPDIESCLASILAQDYPADRLEIIVADGQSTDGTRELLETLCASAPQCRWIDNPGRRAATGLNAALREAHGEILVRVDGHTRLAPDYIRLCVEALSETGADDVGGRLTGGALSPFGRAAAAAISSPFGTGGGRFHLAESEEWVDTVYLGAWRREAFERYGLFDETQVRNQDDEWCYRARGAGARILCRPTIRSETSMRATPLALWRQFFGYGFWKVPVWQKHRTQMRPRHFAPSMLVGFGVGLLFASPFRGAASTAAMIWWPTYVISVLAVTEKVVRGTAGLRRWDVARAIFILHFAYGSGFLCGMVRFLARWMTSWPKPPHLPARSEPPVG